MDKQQALVRAINLTDEILELLEQGEFGRVSDLEAMRKPYIEQAFTGAIEQVDMIRMRHLQNLNEQVVDRLNGFKQAVILQQEQLRAGTKATRAYLCVDSDPK
jgi:hypothetical protein